MQSASLLSSIQLIVGLANPGKAYAETRHNAGAWFIEKLARDTHTALRAETRYHGLYGLTKLYAAQEKPCHLLIPTTFMNLSGISVQSCMQYHKIPPSAVLIVHDEIDLPTGVIKLKFDGGDGGHNGLKDIIRHLNTKQFYRLRVGIGHPGNRNDVVDYVLHSPSQAERKEINSALLRAEDVLPLILQGKMQQAMHQLHSTLE